MSWENLAKCKLFFCLLFVQSLGLTMWVWIENWQIKVWYKLFFYLSNFLWSTKFICWFLLSFELILQDFLLAYRDKPNFSCLFRIIFPNIRCFKSKCYEITQLTITHHSTNLLLSPSSLRSYTLLHSNCMSGLDQSASLCWVTDVLCSNLPQVIKKQAHHEHCWTWTRQHSMRHGQCMSAASRVHWIHQRESPLTCQQSLAEAVLLGNFEILLWL